MEEHTPLTLASAGLSFLFLIVTFFVLTFEVEKERLSHQDAKNPEPPEQKIATVIKIIFGVPAIATNIIVLF